MTPTSPPPVARCRAAVLVAALALAAAACMSSSAPPPADHPAPRTATAPAPAPAPGPVLERPQEKHLRDVRQLTRGGENAEAYWSWDGAHLVYQAHASDRTCDAMRVMRADGSGDRVLASEGANTCGFFLRDDARILFASTRSAGPDCPPPPDRSRGYVWPVHASYDIYTAALDGTDVRPLTTTPGYDAEATVGPDGRIVFTSARDGDLDLYVMQPDGSDVKRLTTSPGYDGGAFFSPDGSLIVYRAHRPADDAELGDFRALLAAGLVRPTRLEIRVMRADGSDDRQVTSLGRAAFAPTFTPDGRRILFASNHEDPAGRAFDLYLVGVDGTGVERVTFDESFDGFPMFSPDGTRLAFASNRGSATQGETNVFVARWVD